MIPMRFRHFIGTGTLTIFDIDDTLFHTTANVMVMKDGKTIHKLSNQQFNTYKLKDGETFDFGEFKNAELFRKTSAPIIKMVERAKRVVKSHNNPHSRAIIVTARADFDDREMFLHTFRDHGIPIDSMHVERSGNFGLSSTAEAKKAVFRKYLNTRNYLKTRLYDDAMANLKAFLELQSEYPNITFEAYSVAKDGTIKVVK